MTEKLHTNALPSNALSLLRDMRNWYMDHQAIHYQPLLDKVDALLAAQKSLVAVTPSATEKDVVDALQVLVKAADRGALTPMHIENAREVLASLPNTVAEVK